MERVFRIIAELPIEVCYSGLRSADELIINFIAADTAPRRLSVVSTDHEIRGAARKRRCPSITSEKLAETLERAAAKPPTPHEPSEKRTGTSGEDTKDWMREFGFDPD